MRARYDKSLVKAVGVLLKFTDPPPVGLSLISKVGYRFRETERKNPKGQPTKGSLS